MSFRDFDLPKVLRDFNLSVDNTRILFGEVPAIAVSSELNGYLTRYLPLGLAIGTEKARSEILVAPLLAEVWYRSKRQVAIYSGLEFTVDSALGLNGVCDFMLGISKQMLFIEAPVVALVEAKRDSIADGLGQCAAAMVAARRFNREQKKPYDTLFGCVTTGVNWKFLKLEASSLLIDADEYSITQPDRILGVLLHCCGVTGGEG